MMKRLRRDVLGQTASLFAFAALLFSIPGWASTGRVALVVGNGAYTEDNIPALANPVNDATLMAKTLEKAGFDVRLVTDADQGEMKASIKAFGEKLVQAGADSVGLFYYAGHGVEVRGQNYLIPIGAEIGREVEFRTDAVPAEWVLAWMDAAGNRLNMVILDACRNNPYGGTRRGGSRGLAQMDAPSGSLIAYAAAPGQAAVDGEGENSPYTAALASALVEPGVKLEDVFKRVRVAVEAETNSEQTPWESSSLRGDFFFVATVEEPRAPEPPTPAVTANPSSDLAARAYEAAERIHSILSYQLVIDKFPRTIYADLAKEQVAKLESAARVPATAPIEKALGLTEEQRVLIQRGLASLEFDVGPPDGKFGRRSRAAINEWKLSVAKPATRYLDADSARILIEAGEAAPTTLTVDTVPLGAQVRVVTPTGAVYEDGMIVPSGQYEIGVSAENFAPFSRSLTVEGPTKYRVALCKLESTTQRICKDKPVSRTRKKVIEEYSPGTSLKMYDDLGFPYEEVRNSSSFSELRSILCTLAKSEAESSAERYCSTIYGGRLVPGTFRRTTIGDTGKTLLSCEEMEGYYVTVIGKFKCRGYKEETYIEYVKDCHDEPRTIRKCPDQIVTRVR